MASVESMVAFFNHGSLVSLEESKAVPLYSCGHPMPCFGIGFYLTPGHCPSAKGGSSIPQSRGQGIHTHHLGLSPKTEAPDIPESLS